MWLSVFFSGLHVTQSGTGAGSTHLYTREQCRIRPHDIYPGGRIVLLIYIQCGAGSGTMACRHFQGIFTASVFLRLSAPRDRMCICNTAHTRNGKCSCQGSPPRHPASASRSRNKLRARSPLPVRSRILRMRKITCQKCTPAGPESVKKRGYGVDPAPESEPFTWLHSHSLCQNSSPAFLAGLPGVCCQFYPFPVRNALRSSERCA